MAIIDTHVHIFDTARTIPWPPSDNPLLYQTTLGSYHRIINVVKDYFSEKKPEKEVL